MPKNKLVKRNKPLVIFRKKAIGRCGMMPGTTQACITIGSMETRIYHGRGQFGCQ